MTERICPTCGRGILTRCGRTGLWERHILPLLGLYPWRCPRCRSRFRLSDRGTGFERLNARSDAHPAAQGSGSAAPGVEANPVEVLAERADESAQLPATGTPDEDRQNAS